jgi:hypothetical protein
MPTTITSTVLVLLYDFTDHSQVSHTPHVWEQPKNVVLEMENAFIVVDGDSFALNCASNVYNNKRHPLGYMQNSTVHNSTGSLLAILFHSTFFTSNSISFNPSVCHLISVYSDTVQPFTLNGLLFNVF